MPEPQQCSINTMSYNAHTPMVPNRYRVVSSTPENHDTVTLELAPLNAGEQCTITPGQFNMLYLFGTGEIPISISGTLPSNNGALATEQRLMHTIRGVGPVSKKFLSLTPGDMIGVRGGFGVGWPLAEALGKDVILIAGGIGLAPLRPVIHALCQHPERYGKLTVIYGARSPADQIFLSELSTWSASNTLTLLSTVDHATGRWFGRVGVVTDVMDHVACTPQDTLAFLCGPEIMMHFSVMALEKMGIAPDNIYLSLERNMKCAIGHCGHCQWGGDFMCKDGPVFPYARIANRLRIRNF